MSKMDLSNIVKGRLNKPRRDVLFAPEGIGKSTFGSQAPSPIFLGAEDGTSQLDVVRFPEPESWQDCLNAIAVLTDDKHKFKTFVVDTLDWMEPLIHDFVCQRDQKSDIESYGYGKGYVAALAEWRIFLHKLDVLRKEKGMGVILLAHSHVKPFQNPEGDDYNRFEMKINIKASGLVKEWADNVFFANYETFTREHNGRTKGMESGARLLYTERRAAFDAKNRYCLAPKFALSWEEVDRAIKQFEAIDDDAIDKLMEQTFGDVKTKAEGLKKKAGNDPQKRAILFNWLKEKVEAV